MISTIPKAMRAQKEDDRLTECMYLRDVFVNKLPFILLSPNNGARCLRGYHLVCFAILLLLCTS
jgi:hypothetical protein